jgi:hypothetical protein
MTPEAASRAKKNPYDPPTADGGAPPQTRALTFAAEDQLPRVCLACGVGAGVKRRPTELGWMPASTYVGIPLGLLPFFVLVKLTRKTAKVGLPLCDPCHGAWLDGSMRRGGLIIGAAVATLVTVVLVLNGAVLAGLLAGALGTAGVAVAWRHFLPADRLRVARIDEGAWVTMAGMHPRAAEAIERMQDEAT